MAPCTENVFAFPAITRVGLSFKLPEELQCDFISYCGFILSLSVHRCWKQMKERMTHWWFRNMHSMKHYERIFLICPLKEFLWLLKLCRCSLKRSLTKQNKKKKVFNYKRVAENVFGKMVQNFEREKSLLHAQSNKWLVVKVTCVLRNWLRQTSAARLLYIIDEMDNGEPQDELTQGSGPSYPGLSRVVGKVRR